MREIDLSLLDISTHPYEPGDKIEGIEWEGVDAGQWCWAACISMLTRWKGLPSIRQCDIAQKLTDNKDLNCCNDKKACAKPCSGDELTEIAVGCGLECTPIQAGILGLAQLQNEISDDHVILAGFQENSDTGHVLLIVGFTADDQILVLDPSRVEFPAWSFNQLESAFGNWIETWLIR